MSEFDNKVVLITGGTSGIGKTTAELFSENGARVIVSGRRKELGEQVSKNIGGMFVECDVSKEEDVIYDPFMGTGTTAIVAKKMNRCYIGSELSSEYCDLANLKLKEV